jgi:hypothetical protein
VPSAKPANCANRRDPFGSRAKKNTASNWANRVDRLPETAVGANGSSTAVVRNSHFWPVEWSVGGQPHAKSW